MQLYLGRWPKAAREIFEKIEISLDLRSSLNWKLGFLFDPEHGDGVFIRNVGFSPNYVALQCNRNFALWGPLGARTRMHIHGAQAYVNTKYEHNPSYRSGTSEGHIHSYITNISVLRGAENL
jgi:hypothetical protein